MANTSVRVPASASRRACRGAIHRPSTDSAPSCAPSWLIGRRDQEEVRVEALGHACGRDPVRERHHQVGGEQQVLAADEIEEASSRPRAGPRGRPRPAGAHRRRRAWPAPPRRRASTRPASSKVSRAAATTKARSGAGAAIGRQLGPRPDRHPAASTLPPGNTSAPEAKSISWWRTTMKTSSPSRPSRRITTVAAGRGVAAVLPALLIQALPCRQRATGTRRDRAGTRAPRRSAGSPARARPRCRTRW